MSEYNSFLLEKINAHMSEKAMQEGTFSYDKRPIEIALFMKSARGEPKNDQETKDFFKKISSQNEDVKIKRNSDGNLSLFATNGTEINDEVKKLKILESVAVTNKIAMSRGFYNRMNQEIIATFVPEEKAQKFEMPTVIKSINNAEDKEELRKIEKTFGSLDGIENGRSLKVAKNIAIGKDDSGNKYIITNGTATLYENASQDSKSSKPPLVLDVVQDKDVQSLKTVFAKFKPEIENFGQGSYDISDKDFEFGRSRTNGASTFVTNLKMNNLTKNYQFFLNGETVSVVEKAQDGNGNNIFKPIQDDGEKKFLINAAIEKINSKIRENPQGRIAVREGGAESLMTQSRIR